MMIKKRIKKYMIFFEIFKLDDIAKFLIEISNSSGDNYLVNESVVEYYNNETSEKYNKKSISTTSEKMLHIIYKFRETFLIKEILRFIEYNLHLKIKRFQYLDDETNCGFISIENGQKKDLSLSNYFEQLRDTICKELLGGR